MVRCQRLAILLVTSWLGVLSLAAPASAQVGYEQMGYGPPPQTGPMMTYAPDGSYCPPPYGGMGYPGAYQVQPQPVEPEWFSGSKERKQLRSFDGWFFRTEYLLWDFKRPGDTLLGSPILGVPDPTVPRDIFDALGNPIGQASIPSLDEMRLDDVSGVRGTIGIPLMFGSFEANMMGFETKDDLVLRNDLGTDPITGLGTFVGTSTFVNGALADNVELYNDTFSASFRSKLWGGETNVFLDGPSSNYFSLSPMFGFKYISLQEILNQDGSFVSAGQPTVFSEIDSDSNNNIFLPQIGLRTQFESKYFTISFDPKVGMGPNKFENQVRTNNFRSNADPEVVTRYSSTQLSTSVDLGFTGRIHLTPNFSITAGYNFVWVGQVSRPQNNIYYNDNGALPTPPGVVVRNAKTDITFQGLTVGAELRFP